MNIDHYQKMKTEQEYNSEISILKETLKCLVIEKYEYEKILHDYLSEPNKKLKNEIDEILLHRRKIIYEIICDFLIEKRNNEHSTLRNQFEKEEDGSFSTNSYNKNVLSQKEKDKLKVDYRQACKLCHPDLVDISLKKEAEEIFKELTYSYRNNDHKRVQQILESLLNGDCLSSTDNPSSKNETSAEDILNIKDAIENLKNDISEILKEYPFLKQSSSRISVEDFYRFLGINDLNIFTKSLKKHLHQIISSETKEKIRGYLFINNNEYYLYCGVQHCEGTLTLSGRCSICNRTFEETYENEIIYEAMKRLGREKEVNNERKELFKKILIYAGIPALWILSYAFGYLK